MEQVGENAAGAPVKMTFLFSDKNLDQDSDCGSLHASPSDGLMVMYWNWKFSVGTFWLINDISSVVTSYW